MPLAPGRAAVSGVSGASGFGLRGRPLRWIAAGRLAALATEWDAEGTAQAAGGAPFTRADLLAHHQAVEAACAGEACLPVRFATWIATPAAVADALAAREADVLAALARVRGCRELAVTLLWADVPSDSTPVPAGGPAEDSAAAADSGDSSHSSHGPLSLPFRSADAADAADAADQAADTGGPGLRYLEQRRRRWARLEARRERATWMAGRLVDELGLAAGQVRYRVCPSRRVALSCAILVSAERAAHSMARARRLCAGWSDVRALVNGAWPPYSFAELGA
jgi:hypothetical protein